MSDQLYTTSRLRVWRECQRKHFYKYTLAIQTPSTPAMAFGTHAHKALELWYRAWECGSLELRLGAALGYIDGIEDISEVERIRLRAIITAYHTRWCNEDWEILGVEVEFRYFLGDVEIGGKIDALVRDRGTGKCWVVEHKTSTADTSPGAPYWIKLALDTQISIYLDGAKFGLDVDVAGCIYDVLKRPMHEIKPATPELSRKFTLGKGCSKCGGSGGGKKGVVQGRGYYDVAFASEVKRNDCDGCKGTGWKLDDEGVPQEPRLHANQRDTDETLDEYEERVVSEIADRIDDFLSRGIIVRLDSELPLRRQELLDTIAAMRALESADLHPPNHGSCSTGRDMCPFYGACSGIQSIDDEYAFPRGAVHPELASAA